jgi:hypothetical protein
MRAIAAVVVLAGCAGGPPTESFEISFHASTDEDEPLGGVRIVTTTNELGTTDEAGDLVLQVRGREGDRVVLGAICPRDHRLLTPPRELVLRKVRSLRGDGAVRVRVQCAPLVRTMVVAIRAQGQRGLPILVDGDVVTALNEAGVAHVMLSGTTEQRFEIAIDTSSNPALQPQNPVRVVAIADRDDLVLYDQPFAADEPEPEPTRGRGRGRNTGPTLPQPLDSATMMGFHGGHFH